MNFEEALKAMLEGKRVKRACYETPIAYNQKRHEFCYWEDDVSSIDGTHYGYGIKFSEFDRVADDWCVVSDTPLDYIKTMEEIKAKTLERIGKEAEKKAKIQVPFLFDEEKDILSKLAKEKKQREVPFNRLEITFKSGETIAYNSGEWDDYAYDGKAVIVKRNGAWVGIYNFADVFCVELK